MVQVQQWLLSILSTQEAVLPILHSSWLFLCLQNWRDLHQSYNQQSKPVCPDWKQHRRWWYHWYYWRRRTSCPVHRFTCKGMHITIIMACIKSMTNPTCTTSCGLPYLLHLTYCTLLVASIFPHPCTHLHALLQVQAHGHSYMYNGVPVFSTVCDCHGYLTLPSMMGIFSSVILLIVLYISIVFMFSIEIMDRFEDPRAPTIHIENLHWTCSKCWL